jgi:hypothetical protein
MENAALDEFTQEQQADFIDYEKELYKLLITVGNVEGARLSESAEFNVSYEDIQYKESPTDTVATQESEINLGLNNPIDIIMKRDNVDEETAVKTYEENIKYRNMGNENLNKPTLDEITTAQAMGIDVTA